MISLESLLKPKKIDYDKEREITKILINYSQCDGSHHKAWCIDQIARIIYGEEYDKFIYNYCHTDENGVHHEELIYDWDTGIAP